MSSGLYRRYRVLWMPLEAAWSAPPASTTFCCDDMRLALDFACDQHASPFDCGDALVIYNPVFDEYGLIVHDGGASYVLINNCPWCAAKLPESQRDRWFDETEKHGDGADALPAIYLSEAWRLPPHRG